jgi:hypothetical protein
MFFSDDIHVNLLDWVEEVHQLFSGHAEVRTLHQINIVNRVSPARGTRNTMRETPT